MRASTPYSCKKLDKWEKVLAKALHAVRSLLCLAVNETPHERLFRSPRIAMNNTALPSWLLTPETVLLRRHVRNKGDRYAIQWSLWKGTRLVVLCVYQTGGKAWYQLPIWLYIFTLTKARTRLALTTPSRKLTVWVALTCEVWQWMKLLTVYEGKWKMTRTLFQRKLTANRLCSTGQPGYVDVNPLRKTRRCKPPDLYGFNAVWLRF